MADDQDRVPKTDVPDLDASDFDDVLAELRRRVERRRAAGDYPPGLEADLNRHFERLRHTRGGKITTEDLENALEMVRATSQFSRERIGRDSNLLGGELVHRTVSKAVGREIDGVFHQLREFSDTVRTAIEQLINAVDDPPRHTHGDILGQLYAIEERLVRVERRLTVEPDPVDALTARIDDLERRLGLQAFDPPYTASEFEAAFRGDEGELRARYQSLADRLVGNGPVLDIGCGRGELLSLLRERGVAAEGVELDRKLCREAQDAGLPVHHADGLVHLERLPEASLGAIVAIQVVEHLRPQQLTDLIKLAASRLKVGGQLLLETPNVQSLYVHARAYWVDPTHVRFVHPAYLHFLAMRAGFRGLEMVFGSPPPSTDVLLPVPDDVPGADVINEDIVRLNRLVFEAQDVLVIATR